MTARTPKVLVMDDEAGIRDILSLMLSARGVYVETAGEGSEALEKYRKALREGHRFDVVILDLTVPVGLGGIETMEQLLAIDPGARGIVASGYSNDTIMSDYRKYGFSGVMAKPFVISDLCELIISLMED
ncbi:MAG TPA: response regulator [Methanoregulaceae archaeon]|nr:response regulator [Methanoregulaceae archaeon]